MSNRLSEIDARLRVLEQAVAGLSARLRAVEDREPARREAAKAPLIDPSDVQQTRAYTTSLLPLIGRSLIVLAGAFLLRAITESGRVPGRAGAMLGLGYAAFWLAAADRQPGSPSRLSRTFHGIIALVIAMPLLWEATTRFQFFVPNASAATFGLLTVLTLVVAWHRDLQIMAAAATVGATVALPALALASRTTGPFALLAVILVAVTWFLGEARGWRWLAWPVGFAELLLVGILLARALATPSLEPLGFTLWVLALLMAISTAPFVIRALRDSPGTRVFDAVHALVAVPICLVGLSAGMAQATNVGVGVIGAGLIAAGAGLYWLGFVRVLPRQGAGRNFYTGTSVALAYVVVGASQLLPGPAASLVCSAAALSALWWSGRIGCAVLVLHATLLLAVAAVESGLVDAAFAVWIGWPQAWPPMPLVSIVVLATLVGGMVYAITRPAATPRWLSITAHVLLNGLALMAMGGAVLIWLGPFLSGTPPAPAALATMKTSVLATSAVVLSILGRQVRWREIGWLAYPALAVGAVQLLVEHLTASHAATWFVALVIYGVAVVITSRSIGHR